MRIERIGERELVTEAHVARELGIGLRTDQEPAAYEAIARRAGEAGLDVLSVFHDLLYQPAIGPLLLMARVTERIRLGPAAAQSVHAASVRDRRPDRDARHRFRRSRVPWPREGSVARSARDRRSTTALRAEGVGRDRQALLSGDESGVAGERFTLSPGTTLAYPRVRHRVPLLIGTWGEDTALGRRWPTRSRSAAPRTLSCSLSCAAGSTTRRSGSWSAASPSSTRTVTGRERARPPSSSRTDVVARHDPTLEPGEEPPRPLLHRRHARGGRRARARAVGGGRGSRRARYSAGPDAARRSRAGLRAPAASRRPLTRFRTMV